MSTSHPLKLSLIIAGVMAMSSGFAADQMSRDQYKAAKDQIETQYKADKEACDALKDNAKDVCEKEAKAKEKIARAELDFKRSGEDRDRMELAEVKAEQEYAVAKERCDDMSGEQKDACQKEARAVEAKAKAEMKANAKAETTPQGKAVGTN